MARVLILSNDTFRTKAKTCEYLASACRRLGHFVVVRDTSDIRLALEEKPDSVFLKNWRSSLAHKWTRILDYLEVDTIMALDLDWLLLPDEFLQHPHIRKIFSIWYDDLRSWRTGSYKGYFPTQTNSSLIDILNHPKITHVFYSKAQLAEASLLGITSTSLHLPLAAPMEWTQTNSMPEIADKVAFIGNPGHRMLPPQPVLDALKKGADLNELRQLSCSIILQFPPQEWNEWVQKESSIKDFMEFSLALRVKQPSLAAAEILQLAASGYSNAFDFLKQNDQLLTACAIIKLINQYDRPAWVHRMAMRGLADVHSAPDEWAAYGITSNPMIPESQLPLAYQRYALHLNAANPLRDAVCNEKLFETAACARVSVNIEHPDLWQCYSHREIATATSLESLETTCAQLLAQPKQLLAMGNEARRSTLARHTWDARIACLF